MYLLYNWEIIRLKIIFQWDNQHDISNVKYSWYKVKCCGIWLYPFQFNTNVLKTPFQCLQLPFRKDRSKQYKYD